MSRDIYRELQERLDKYSVGFPAAESGAEIKILKKLFSEEDATISLALSPKLELPEEIASRLDIQPRELALRLEDMAQRGLLFRLEKNGLIKYGAIPFVHGVFEFQVTRMDKELALLLEEYFHECFDQAMAASASWFLRTIPVQRSLDVNYHVAAYEDASQMLRQAKQIVLADCICRKQKSHISQDCQKPVEVCFMFGSMGQYYLDHGMGRRIEIDEAIKVLTAAQEAGLVTQPATTQNPGGMCNCCGDCCGVLRALNKLDKPAEKVFSNFFAAVEAELCTGCETCLDRCQMQALSMNEDGLAEVNLDRCIGCGLCVTTCPTEALSLTPKPESKQKTPPVTAMEQMIEMARQRGVI